METIETLYQQYHKPIFTYLYGLTHCKQAAEDLTQETFLQIIKSIHTFRGDSKVTTWIYGIARNVYRKWVVKNKNLKIDFSPIPDDHPDMTQSGSPEKTLESKEISNVIYWVLSCMPEHQKELIILRDWHSLSYEEIAKIMNRSLSWVKVNIYRSRAAFQKIYSQKEELIK